MAFTFFFRDEQTLSCALDFFVPYVRNLDHIYIWSAGCAKGQEPYTFAILLRERMDPFQFRKVKIIATDIDESNQSCSIITTGRYPLRDIQRIPPEIQEKYFYPCLDDSDYVQISDEIRRPIEFRRHDLRTDEGIFSGIHLIICKNVLLHLSPEERLRVWKMFWNVLDEGGYMLHEEMQILPEKVVEWFERPIINKSIYKKKPH